jgi:hypothetical protein
MNANTQNIVITWCAFGHRPESDRWISSVSITTNFYDSVTDEKIMDILFQETNLYKGHLWDLIEPKLCENRTHTSLSVGDEITIFSKESINTYKIASTGFDLVNSTSTSLSV